MKGLRAHFSIFPLFIPLLAGFFATAAPAEQLADLAKPTDYVSDFAHVLSPEAIARLDSLCGQLDHSQANAQIAVVTVRNLDGEDAAEYANELEDKWKIGPKGTDRGALVLLAVDDHKYRIDVGYGLEGILPDGKVGDIGREMVPFLRAGDYDSAVTQTVGEVAQVIAADAKVTLADEPAMPQQPVRESGVIPIGKVILLILVLIFFGGSSLFRLLLGFGLFSSWAGRGRWMSGGGGGYGGGFGGGGSFGGGAGDGGFGGFGGGGFGGGGAGGSW